MTQLRFGRTLRGCGRDMRGLAEFPPNKDAVETKSHPLRISTSVQAAWP